MQQKVVSQSEKCQAELVEAGLINLPAFDKLRLTAQLYVNAAS